MNVLFRFKNNEGRVVRDVPVTDAYLTGANSDNVKLIKCITYAGIQYHWAGTTTEINDQGGLTNVALFLEPKTQSPA